MQLIQVNAGRPVVCFESIVAFRKEGGYEVIERN